ERLINKTMEGRAGADQIKALMAAFREQPPQSIAGLAVTEVFDYKTHEVRQVGSKGGARHLPEPSGDLLIFHLSEPGTRFAARPSGTEPKIKFYLFARTDTKGLRDQSQLAEVKARTARQLDRMASDLEQYIRRVVESPA
ncbi:MAG TPA: phospho-sugar mutase, partial [Isosphaeraceae bacterium]|nr:phospho-sugar mutase [Isosphaeraceae bacterium]